MERSSVSVLVLVAGLEVVQYLGAGKITKNAERTKNQEVTEGSLSRLRMLSHGSLTRTGQVASGGKCRASWTLPSPSVIPSASCFPADIINGHALTWCCRGSFPRSAGPCQAPPPTFPSVGGGAGPVRPRLHKMRLSDHVNNQRPSPSQTGRRFTPERPEHVGGRSRKAHG